MLRQNYLSVYLPPETGVTSAVHVCDECVYPFRFDEPLLAYNAPLPCHHLLVVLQSRVVTLRTFARNSYIHV